MTLLTAVAAVLLGASSISALNADGWRQLSVYQALTDRYATTDGSTPECWIRDYCGGTWRGMINKLDYIQGMGFEAVWISPVIHQIEGNTTYGYAWHGYWGNDPFHLNEHFGTPQDLKDLSAALHSRGMYLMVDVVINHFAFFSNTTDVVDFSEYPPPFNNANAFHPLASINYNNQTSTDDGWLVAYGPPLLPDINSENETVFGTLVQTVVDIVKNYSVDGIRLDTARQVAKPALRQFQEAVGVYVTGEVFVNDYSYSAQYVRPVGPLQSVLNYPMFSLIQNAFTGVDTFDYLASTVRSQTLLFEDPNVLLTFADNHDNSRFASLTGDDILRDMNAITFVLLTGGVPAVYYGFEQRMVGSYDPINRAPLWSTGYGYNTTSPLYQYISKLHTIRKLASRAASSKAAFFSAQSTVLGNSDIYMAFERGPLVVVVTNVGTTPNINEPDFAANSTVHPDFKVASSSFARYETVVDVLSCETARVGRNGEFVSPSAQGMPRVWIAESVKGTMCM